MNGSWYCSSTNSAMENTVAILAQGTSLADAAKQASWFFSKGKPL
jgi:hypothetical protein